MQRGDISVSKLMVTFKSLTSNEGLSLQYIQSFPFILFTNSD